MGAERFEHMREEALAQIKKRIDSGWWTERQFARICQISQGQLNNILRGRRKASIETLDHLLNRAGIDRCGNPTR